MIANTVNPAYIDVNELHTAISIASRIVLFLKLLKEHNANWDPRPNDKDSNIWLAALYQTSMSYNNKSKNNLSHDKHYLILNIEK